MPVVEDVPSSIMASAQVQGRCNHASLPVGSHDSSTGFLQLVKKAECGSLFQLRVFRA